MSAGRSKIASGVDGVEINVAVGSAVIVGTAVGSATTVSVAELPQALSRTRIRMENRKCLTRTVHTPKIKNG
jgi:hypothetical protein